MGDGAQGGAGLAPPAFPPLAHLLHTLRCPCFYPGFGQGTRAKARKTSRRILPWAAGEPGGAEVSCLFKVQTSAVNLLPVCISLEPLSAGPGGGGERRWGLPFVRGQGQAIGNGGEKTQRGSWNLLWEGKIFFGYL